MSESLRRSLKKAGKSLIHDVLAAVSTAAVGAAGAWLLAPGTVEGIIQEIAPGKAVAILLVWTAVKPALVTWFDQRKHGRK